MVLVSKDIPLRVKAGAVGLPADEYHAHDVVPSGWTGMTELDVQPVQVCIPTGCCSAAVQ